MKEMTRYDVAYEQYRNEVGGSKESFDKKIEEHGQDYVAYYANRWQTEMAGYATMNFESED